MNENERKKTDISFKNGINIEDGDKKVKVSLKGVHVKNADEDVSVSSKGIHIESSDKSIHMDKGEMREFAKDSIKKHKGIIFINLSIILVAVLAYIIIGSKYGNHGWGYGWLVLLAALVVDSLINAIVKKKPSEFAYVLLVVLVYLLLGLFMHLWHPAWIIFLTIPVYYMICDKIQNAKNKEE